MEAAAIQHRARRRMHHIASHLGPEDDASDHHPPPLLCRAPASSALAYDDIDEAIRPRDNRTYYARQSSDSHGQFMRQVVKAREEDKTRLRTVSSTPGPETCRRSASALENTREALEHGTEVSLAAGAAFFGRRETEAVDKLVTDGDSQNQQPRMPALAHEVGSTSQAQCKSEKPESPSKSPTEVESGQTAHDQGSSACFSFEWFPRMDVVESGTAYVITVELPGVSSDGIHVEVVRGSLIVTGSRATDWWKINSDGNNGGGTVYHRRELDQGPFRATWSLPKRGDINGITAEFIDGFLRVLVPKLKIMAYL